MEKRSVNSDDGEWVKEEEPEVIEIEFRQTYPSKQLVLMKDLKLNITGAVSGYLYTWDGAGSVVDVDERDVPAMMNRIIARSCCGSIPTPYFTIIGG